MISNDFAIFIRIMKNYNLIPYGSIKETVFNERFSNSISNCEVALKHNIKLGHVKNFFLIIQSIAGKTGYNYPLYRKICKLLDYHYWNDKYHWLEFQNDLENLLFEHNMLTDEMLNLKL